MYAQCVYIYIYIYVCIRVYVYIYIYMICVFDEPGSASWKSGAEKPIAQSPVERRPQTATRGGCRYYTNASYISK